MFNAKVSFLYLSLVVLCVLSILTIVTSGEKDTIKKIEAQLRTRAGGFMMHKELREARLRGFSKRVGSSHVGAVLETLSEYRNKFIEVDRFICDEKTGIKCDMVHPKFNSERSKKAAAEYGDTLFLELSARLAKRFKDFHPEWTEQDVARVKSESRKKLIDCFGRGSQQCDWAFTYAALCGPHSASDDEGNAKEQCVRGLLNDLRQEHVWPGGHAGGPDIVLVFDSKGVGIANAQNAQWSNRSEFTGMVDRLRQFVMRGDNKGVTPVYYDLLEWQDGGAAEYLVAIVPLVTRNGKFLGAVLTGENISGKMVEVERRLYGDHVTYIMGDKPLASTMQESEYKHFLASATVARRLKPHSANIDEFFAFSFPYFDYPANAPKGEGASVHPTFFGGVAYGPNYQKLRIVLATDHSRWLSPFEQLKGMIPIFGIGIFLVGVILIFFLVRNFTRPYEAIDAGIHEVCAGDFEYQFPFDYNDDAASAMAQSLNLMMAVLLGNPLPEDQDDEDSQWNDNSRWVERRGGTLGANGGLVIEDGTSMDELESISEEMLTESSEAYYRRLYEEYRGASREAGLPDGVITYVRFVERLAKSERELKERLKCTHVRYCVEKDEGRVVLRPSAIS